MSPVWPVIITSISPDDSAPLLYEPTISKADPGTKTFSKVVLNIASYSLISERGILS